MNYLQFAYIVYGISAILGIILGIVIGCKNKTDLSFISNNEIKKDEACADLESALKYFKIVNR